MKMRNISYGFLSALMLALLPPFASAHACLTRQGNPDSHLMPHAPRQFHGIYDLVIEGDGQSVLVMELWEAPGRGTSVYLMPSTSPAHGPRPTCGGNIVVKQRRQDMLEIDIADGCRNQLETWRYDADGLRMVLQKERKSTPD